ncbi:hypothetical protein H1R20_g12470, partial [Candolleomyces eurysporus]
MLVQFSLVWLVYAISAVLSAPTVSLVSNNELDARGIYFVSYDGLVNVNSFQLSGVLTHGNYQYAAWYTSSSCRDSFQRMIRTM